MAELPIAPGQIYIEVEYDYEYKSKDRLITIRHGECYMLVKKTNDDWWQVKKEEGTKAFYVPAQYVREVRKALMPPSKPVPHPPSASGDPPARVKPTYLELGSSHDRPAEGLHRNESKGSRRSPSALTSSSTTSHFSPPVQRRNSNHHHPPPPPHPPHAPGTPTEQERALAGILVSGVAPQASQKGQSSTLPRARARSPEELTRARSPEDPDPDPAGPQLCDSAGEERRTIDSEPLQKCFALPVKNKRGQKDETRSCLCSVWPITSLS
ncbi:unnamed protein product [Menidia menidia]|uniref:(Atlantic silverside) hypothetical protein n=1 Tax=Menidia menidia TaxID=238744 RepID=A0A8S4ANI9_9TELE|nr:unnamed protein product [Menidia menidia]